MQTRWISRSLCVLCLSMATVVVAGSQTPSVLDRVQRVDDPQLGELIRVAMGNRENLGPDQKLELMRKVTLAYAQIRLFDQQIAEISRKIASATGPAEMRYELLLARTELESKLMTEITNLREVMGVVPKYPFDKQPVGSLRTWLRLNHVYADSVYVLNTQKPISEYWAYTRSESLGLMSQKEALGLIQERLRDPNNLPARIDILWVSESAEALRDKTLKLVRDMGSAMQVEVNLDRNDFIGSGEAPFFIRQGKITTLYPVAVFRPEGGPNDFLTTGPVDPQELAQHILWRITYQWNLPVTFRIEHDQAGSDLARRIADEVAAISRRLGVSELVHAELVPVEPVPERAFLGRWKALGKGEIQTIEIQPEGVCELAMGPKSRQAGTNLTCPWTPTTKEIIIDPKENAKENWIWYTYRASINADGNLAVDKGVIYPQGTFFRSGDSVMVFEPVK